MQEVQAVVCQRAIWIAHRHRNARMSGKPKNDAEIGEIADRQLLVTAPHRILDTGETIDVLIADRDVETRPYQDRPEVRSDIAMSDQKDFHRLSRTKCMIAGLFLLCLACGWSTASL
jgi:hypothetical protein